MTRHDDDDWKERRDIVMNHETLFRPEHGTNRIYSNIRHIYIVMRWKMGGGWGTCWHNVLGLDTRCVCMCSSLKDIEIFAISKLWVFLAENPCDHLPRLHGCPYDVTILVPAVRWLFWPLLHGRNEKRKDEMCCNFELKWDEKIEICEGNFFCYSQLSLISFSAKLTKCSVYNDETFSFLFLLPPSGPAHTAAHPSSSAIHVHLNVAFKLARQRLTARGEGGSTANGSQESHIQCLHNAESLINFLTSTHKNNGDIYL